MTWTHEPRRVTATQAAPGGTRSISQAAPKSCSTARSLVLPSLLRERGLIETVHGRGTFVVAVPRDGD